MLMLVVSVLNFKMAEYRKGSEHGHIHPFCSQGQATGQINIAVLTEQFAAAQEQPLRPPH